MGAIYKVLFMGAKEEVYPFITEKTTEKKEFF